MLVAVELKSLNQPRNKLRLKHEINNLIFQYKDAELESASINLQSPTYNSVPSTNVVPSTGIFETGKDGENNAGPWYTYLHSELLNKKGHNNL